MVAVVIRCCVAMNCCCQMSYCHCCCCCMLPLLLLSVRCCLSLLLLFSVLLMCCCCGQVVKLIGSRKDLTEDRLDELEELVMDSTKAEAIFDAAKMSMGMWPVVHQAGCRGVGLLSFLPTFKFAPSWHFCTQAT